MPAISLPAPAVALATERNVPRLQVQGLDPAYVGGFGVYLDADGGALDLGALEPGEVYLSADAADDLGAGPDDQLALFFTEEPVLVRVAGVFHEGGSTSGDAPLSVMRLADLQAILGQQGHINVVFISNDGGPIAGERHTQVVLDAFEALREERGLDSSDVKREGIELADEVGDQFASIFLLFGTFSILAGILLIALIFVMLAAERKRELGIARAVGAQRGHIVRLFMFEGAVYSLAAAAVGSALGIAVGLVMVRIMAAAFGAIDELADFEIAFSFRWRSLLLAYTLGMVVTYVVVVISAARVSVLNIVRAVRDIPEPPKEGQRLRAYWRALATAYLDALRAVPRLDLLRALRRVLLSGPRAAVRLAWALFMSGYLMCTLGALLAFNGVSAEQLGVFSVGLSLVVVGVPTRTPSRRAAAGPHRLHGRRLAARAALAPSDRLGGTRTAPIQRGYRDIHPLGGHGRGGRRLGRHVQLGVPGQCDFRPRRPGAHAGAHHPDGAGISDGEPLPHGDDLGDVLSRHLHPFDHRFHRRFVQQRVQRHPEVLGWIRTSRRAPVSPTRSVILGARIEESSALDPAEFAAVGAMSGLPVRIRQGGHCTGAEGLVRDGRRPRIRGDRRLRLSPAG